MNNQNRAKAKQYLYFSGIMGYKSYKTVEIKICNRRSDIRACRDMRRDIRNDIRDFFNYQVQ